MELYKSLLFIVLLLTGCGASYLPVILLHGVFAKADNMDELASMITSAHPGTQVYNIRGYGDLLSMEKMWTQVTGFRKQMLPIFANSTDGVNMLCFSQGGIVCRAILETTPEHNVKTFISLSGPQGGQFGDTSYLNSSFLLPNFTKEDMHYFFYTPEGQEIAIANYWKDPHHMKGYLKHCEFLPRLEKPSDDSRKNFLKLKDLVLIGGPNDGVITPWQSSQFASYDENELVVDMENQEFYLNDSFGLKTLNSLGKLHIHTVPGVRHVEWHRTESVFKCCIEPYLH